MSEIEVTGKPVHYKDGVLTLAVPMAYKDRYGHEDTEVLYEDCVLIAAARSWWENGKHMAHPDSVTATGSFKRRVWTDESGKAHSAIQLMTWHLEESARIGG